MAYQSMVRGRAVPLAVRSALRRMPPGTQYLGEDRHYYHFVQPGMGSHLDGFDIGNMFKRMVKFTPKSFTPGNIYKGFINTTLTAATGGLYQVLPKNIKKTVYEVGKVAVPVVAGGVLAYTAGPAVMAVIGPKLTAAGSILGKAASTVGGGLLNMLTKMSQSSAAKVATQVTPEQIAQWDQSGVIPAGLEQILAQAMQNSLPQTGAATLYDPSAMAAAELQRQQAGQEQGGFDWSTLALIGLPAIAGVYFLTKR